MEAVIAREKPDFVQIDYSIADREAQKRILPLAAEVKAGVLTALPFGRGRLFRAVHDKPLPDWAKDFTGSWAQFFLKYLIADERVTTVIPGTANPGHMADNLGAMHGRLPDAQERSRRRRSSGPYSPRAPTARHGIMELLEECSEGNLGKILRYVVREHERGYNPGRESPCPRS